MKAQFNNPPANFRLISAKFSLAIMLIIFPGLVSLSQPTHFILNGNDNGPGSLRQTLAEAASGDTIRFMADVDTVFLTSGELLIDKSIVISGNPAFTFVTKHDTIPKFRIFRIQSADSLVVEFRNLSVMLGHAPDGTTSGINGQHGGGIYIPDSIHELILKDCLINENQAGEGIRRYQDNITGNGGSGGGIYSLSKVQLYNCQVNGNEAGNGANASSGGDWNSQSAGSGGSGGGIYCINDLFFENCSVNYNQSGAGGNASGTTYSSGGNGGAGGSGGAVYCKYGTINIINTVLNNNSSGKGGNAWNMQSSCSGGSAGNGGAIYLSESSVTITSSEVNGNFAGNGGSGSGNESGHGKNGGNGGGIYAVNCQLAIGLTEIGQNHTGAGGYSGGYTTYVSPGSGGNGGGIYTESSMVKLDDCLIAGNYTGNGATAEFFYSGGGHGGSGGGIYIFNSYDGSRLGNCRIENNHTGNGGKFNEVEIYTDSPVANGGCGGGLAINYSFIEIVNCLISGNKSGNAVFKTVIPPGGDYALPKGGSGGGIYIYQSNHQIINSTVANNSAGTAVIVSSPEKVNLIVSDSVRGQGGGIFSVNVQVNAINSIIAENYILDYSILNDIEGLCLLNYSLLSTDTLSDITPGDGNLVNYDPAFFSFPDDFSLAPTSFAINHGSPDTTGLYLPPSDLAGKPRIYGERIDMGAYEYQGEPQDQYSISTNEIEMDSIVMGGFTIDSLSILNSGLTNLTINIIQTNPIFSLSLDKIDWTNQINGIILPSGEPFSSLEIYIKFEGLAPGFFTDSITIIIGDSVNAVHISGFCESKYTISTYEIKMDSIVLGGFAFDSLSIRNENLTTLTITKIKTYLPFSVSLDRINWTDQLDEVSIPAGEPFTPLVVYVKFEGLVTGFYSNNIIFTISDVASFVQISGFCKSTEGINEDEKDINLCLSPNPFNRETRISFSLEENADITIVIFNSRGIKVDEITLKNQQAGINNITWHRKNLSSGLYYYRLAIGEMIGQGKLIIIDY